MCATVSLREIMMTQAPVRAMRGLAAALFLTVGACGQPTMAQSFQDFSDDVMLYVRDDATEHASIVLFDRLAADANTTPKRPVVALTLAFSEEAPKWDYRAAIDDKLGDILKGVPAQLAATHTEPQQGLRTYLLVTDAPAETIAALEKINPPAGVKVTARQLSAADLDVWRPTRLEFQTSQDDTVRKSLANSGDDGSKPRAVEFFFYKGDQVGLRTAAKAAGFQARKSDGEPEGSVLALLTAVDTKTLNILNSRFLDWSDRFHAEYDGWETEVAKK
jgi:hypothetical protein